MKSPAKYVRHVSKEGTELIDPAAKEWMEEENGRVDLQALGIAEGHGMTWPTWLSLIQLAGNVMVL